MSEDTLTQVCTSCEEELPLSEFYPDARKRSGRSSICSQCIKLRNMLKSISNKDTGELLHERETITLRLKVITDVLMERTDEGY